MLFDRILQDRKGGVAPLLALAIIPIVGAVGAAVDYSRANLVRTAMQNALDSSALMLSKDAQTTIRSKGPSPGRPLEPSAKRANALLMPSVSKRCRACSTSVR